MFVYASLQSMVSLSCKLLAGYQTFTLRSTGKPPSHQAHSTVELTPSGSWESSELGESNIARELWLRPRLFPGMKTRCRLACRPCDSTSRKLNKTSLREKFRGVYLSIGWVFTGYLMIFRLSKTSEFYVRLLRVLSVPWKCVIVWFPHGVDR